MSTRSGSQAFQIAVFTSKLTRPSPNSATALITKNHEYLREVATYGD